MSLLEVRDFSKSYNQKDKAVDNISFSVESGDIFAFIGHNGAGKSTTIKAIVGILDYEDGEILIDGHSVKENPLYCKSIFAYIPDNPDLYEYLTGIQYLNFIADVFGVSKIDREERIQKYADAFEITGHLGNLISSYSHGMRQKVAIIGALVHMPKLLILDEPFVGLDPKAVFVLKNLMKEICDAGGAVFFSTHVLDVAEKLCNKMAMINHGKLVVTGDMKQVLGEGNSLEEIFLEAIHE